MAFNNVGNYWLAPGESVTIGLRYGALAEGQDWGGVDHGAQWIMADAIGIRPARLLVTNHTKVKRPLRRPSAPSPIAYEVTVVNIGDEAANFSLQGGGNV
jgi:hypothetical protein